MSKFLAVKACEWLSSFRGGGMGKLNGGGGKLALKIKPHSNRKILRHEPLEDRHLLVVDLAGGMSSALLPQEEMAIVSAPQTSTQLAPEVESNINETALIPNDIAESENGSDETNINATNLADQEADSALQSEITSAFCGPMTWREWLESRGETDSTSYFARPMTAEESEMYVTALAGLSGVGVLPGIDPDPGMVTAAAGNTGPYLRDTIIRPESYILDAHAGSATAFLGTDIFVPGQPASPLTYAVVSAGDSTIVDVRLWRDMIFFTSQGKVGSTTVVVTATDSAGLSATWTVGISTFEVQGYRVQERAWGETAWHDVEDRDKTSAGNWQLLWQENEYRFQPIIAGMDMFEYVSKVKMTAHPVVNGVVNLSQSQSVGESTYIIGSPYTNNIFNIPYPTPKGEDYARRLWAQETELWVYGRPAYAECVLRVEVTTMGGCLLYGVDQMTFAKVGNGKMTDATVQTFNKKHPRLGVTGIASVQWVTRERSETRNPGAQTAADLAKLESYGGAYRTFPEQTEPDTKDANGDTVKSTNYDKVEAKVTLTAAIPTGMEGTVYLRIFDPKNAHAETSPSVFLPDPDDNYGAMVFSNRGNVQLVKNSDGTSFTKDFEITSAHAGDNYIVAVHPNTAALSKYRFYTKQDAYATGCGDLPLDKVASKLMRSNPNVTTTSPGNPPVGYSWLDSQHQTSVLTVWRTLWVELDKTSYYNSWLDITDPAGFPIGNISDVSEAETPTITGLVTSQLARACIDAQLYQFSDSQPTKTLSNPLDNNPIFSSRNDYTYLKNNARDIPETSDRNFLAVRVIAVSSKEKNNPGTTLTTTLGTSFTKGHILVFYESIKASVESHNFAYGLLYPNNPELLWDISDLYEYITLHEIGHSLINEDHNAGVGIMRPTIEEFEENSFFTPENIQMIQKNSRIRT